ncbi:Prophage CP4-57 integrase [Pseudomonas sp. 31 R 17]|nr:integrase arm-type DNA-binding domain-containing protein [Pseudomonas sp. 31 R 17]CRM08121.1 Prophage CP4-57 integrase [Pseudomonas sp. 31 R 17]
MCAQTTRLSDRQLKAVKPKDKDYVLTDGDGLQLRVRVNRSMQWNFNYRHPVTKNRINMALGSYPEVSLAQARKKTVEARELLAQGIDPKAQRNELQEAKRAETEHTFENVAIAWFELKKDSVTPAYAEDIWRSLTLHVFPSMKSTPLSEVSAPMVIKLLRPIEAKGSLETVKRVSQRLNEIMTYGVNSGMIFANPLSGIRAVFKKPKKVNMAALPPDELPELVIGEVMSTLGTFDHSWVEVDGKIFDIAVSLPDKGGVDVGPPIFSNLDLDSAQPTQLRYGVRTTIGLHEHGLKIAHKTLDEYSKMQNPNGAVWDLTSLIADLCGFSLDTDYLKREYGHVRLIIRGQELRL